MSGHSQLPRSLQERLLEQDRRTAGVDSNGQPVRLGERDSTGYMVGYIDEHRLAWESLTERIVAIHGGRLAEALERPRDAPQRDTLIDQVLAELPDELIGDVAREAAGALWLRLGRRA